MTWFFPIWTKLVQKKFKILTNNLPICLNFDANFKPKFIDKSWDKYEEYLKFFRIAKQVQMIGQYLVSTSLVFCGSEKLWVVEQMKWAIQKKALNMEYLKSTLMLILREKFILKQAKGSIIWFEWKLKKRLSGPKNIS